MSRPSPENDPRSSDERLFRNRTEALERFAAWAAEQPVKMSAQAALRGIGLLYELLPPEARTRAVDTEGVQRLHRALSVLSRR